MKKIKNIIILIAILIVIIIVALISLKIIDIKEEKRIEQEGDPGIETIITNESEEVSSKEAFYTVKQCIQQYYDMINNNSSSYYTQDEEGNEVKLLEQEEINQIKLDLLSKEYIEENNINTKNVEQYVDQIEEKTIVTILKMKQIINVPTEKYLVYGMISNLEYQALKGFYIFVNLDKENQTFSIEPITKKYNTIEEIPFTNTNQEVKENENNLYEEQVLDYEQTAREYILFYKQLALTIPQTLYDNYMEEEYKTNRFGNRNEFINFIEKNKEEISDLRIQKYQVNNYEEYSEYVCMDQYQRLYIFKEKNPMDFTLTLDTYTIASEKFKSEYNEAKEQKKVAMNIDKWVQMLNNRDYKSAYKLLDENYRKNIFGNEEEFENQIKEKLPSCYKIEYKKFSEEKQTYVQNINLLDITNENDNTINMSIIMQLKEDTNFVMSFNIEENEE